ncbi:glutamine--fructose-6-phosphate transaminase (isomerizing) [bacterium]|nr:glutamine--fructose-6-phosphate transaminase (isomerizing) [bacterium]
MCGIVGYVGSNPVLDILLDGLEQLEYRGYDSSGIAVRNGDKINVYKAVGKLKNLREELSSHAYEIQKSTSGIGHIRWATHGAPTVVNAHPHVSNCGKLVVVHNGIIENYKELKSKLEAQGCTFKSQTDTETVAHLVALKYEEVKDLTKAVGLAVNEIEGAYALEIMHADEPDKIVITKRNAPLIIGVANDGFYAGSDIPAFIKHTNKAVYLSDNQIATLTSSSMKIQDKDGNEVTPKIEQLPWEPVALSKMGYKHFMLKEIHEQPDVVRNILFGKLHSADTPIELEEVKLTREHLKSLNRIQIIACGTSLHAGMIGKYLIEDFCQIPVDIEASSEYIYRKTVTDEHTLVIGVSQSGETADTLTAIKQAKARGSHILIITNRPDSAMAREADSLLSVNAGIEVSVAATKSYIAQLTSFYLLALFMAEIKETLDNVKLSTLKSEMLILPQKIEQILSNKDKIQTCARKYSGTRDFIYIARGINYPTALEGALKLKEISYINATGYPAGELKHGPIAMLDETMPVLSILMKGSVYDKLLSNSEEARARNARMIALTNSDSPKLDELFDCIIKVPDIDEILSPIISIIPLQLIAYYIAEFLGKDVDQPRNLAKSVTVE